MKDELNELSIEYDEICREFGERNAHSWVRRAMIFMQAQNKEIIAMRIALEAAKTGLMDAEKHYDDDMCRKAMNA